MRRNASQGRDSSTGGSMDSDLRGAAGRDPRGGAGAGRLKAGCRALAGLVPGLLLLCSASMAHAQMQENGFERPTFDLQLFRPAVDSKGYVTLNASQVLGHTDFSLGLVGTWAGLPLQLRLDPMMAAQRAAELSSRSLPKEVQGLSDWAFSVPVHSVASLLGFEDDQLADVTGWMRRFVACLSPLSARPILSSTVCMSNTVGFWNLRPMPSSAISVSSRRERS